MIFFPLLQRAVKRCSHVKNLQIKRLNIKEHLVIKIKTTKVKTTKTKIEKVLLRRVAMIKERSLTTQKENRIDLLKAINRELQEAKSKAILIRMAIKTPIKILLKMLIQIKTVRLINKKREKRNMIFLELLQLKEF